MSLTTSCLLVIAAHGGGSMHEVDRAKWAGVMASYLPPHLARWYLAGPAHDEHPVVISGAEAVRLGARACRR